MVLASANRVFLLCIFDEASIEGARGFYDARVQCVSVWIYIPISRYITVYIFD